MPELVPGNSRGTILDDDIYVSIVKKTDYMDHYPKKNADGAGVFARYGHIDRNGMLRSKIELRKDDRHTY